MWQAKKAYVGLSVWVGLGAQVAHAATSVAVQPGLWVGASETTINGKRLPTLLDIHGALSAEQKSQITKAMSAHGLPAGWQPGTMCVTASSYDLNAFLSAAGRQGCALSSVQSTPGHVRFKGRCDLPNPGLGPTVGDVEGELSLTGKTDWRMETRMTGTIGGYAMTSVSKQVGKWIAADCRAVPKGLEDGLLGGAADDEGDAGEGTRTEP